MWHRTPSGVPLGQGQSRPRRTGIGSSDRSTPSARKKRCGATGHRIFSDAAWWRWRPAHTPCPAGLGRYGDGRFSLGVRHAIDEGIRTGPVQRLRKRTAERRENRSRLRLLKDWRVREANRLKLSPFLLWSTTSLARLSTTWTETTRWRAKFDDGSVRSLKHYGCSCTVVAPGL